MTLKAGALIVVLAAFAMPAFADTYAIDFSLTSGTVSPTSGSFEYTPEVGFSSFIVQWAELPFDLAQNDNDFTGCFPTPQVPGALAFALMSHECTAGSTYEWFGVNTQQGFTQFVFRELPSLQGFGLDKATPGLEVPPASGTWTIRNTNVLISTPEPASIGLLGIGLGAIGVLRKRWNRATVSRPVRAA